VSAAYQKFPQHLITFLGDAFLRVSISRLIHSGHEPQVCSHRATLLEAVGILQGEHEGERCKRSDTLDLPQQTGFRIVLFGDLLQLALVVADALCERAYLCSKMGPRAGKSASGMCSAALLWKLLAGHLGNLPPNDLTAPLRWFTSCVRQLTSACLERIKAI
jgi:hypothetical protein